MTEELKRVLYGVHKRLALGEVKTELGDYLASEDGVEKVGSGLTKEAMSALRKNLRMVYDAKNLTHRIFLGNSHIGDVAMAKRLFSKTPIIHTMKIDPKYRGLGITDKVYGEILKSAPGKTLYSDRLQSEGGRKLWEKLKKKDYIQMKENPLAYSDDLLSKEYPNQSLFAPRYKAKMIFKNEVPAGDFDLYNAKKKFAENARKFMNYMAGGENKRLLRGLIGGMNYNGSSFLEIAGGALKPYKPAGKFFEKEFPGVVKADNNWMSAPNLNKPRKSYYDWSSMHK